MAYPWETKLNQDEKLLVKTIKQKSLHNYYKTYEDFWTGEQMQKRFIAFAQYKPGVERLGFKWFVWKVYSRWCYNTFFGTWNQFRHRFSDEIVTKFQELKRKEDLFQKIFPNIKLKVEKLITLRNVDKTTGNKIQDRFQDKSSDRDSDRENKKMSSEVMRSKARPFQAIDMIGGEFGIQEKEAINEMKQRRGNWTSAEVEVQSGFRKRSEKDPDRWEWHPNVDRGTDKLRQRDKDRDKGTQRDMTTKIVTREEQPQFLTQISKLVDQCMSLELPISEYVDSFAHNFYLNVMFAGELKWSVKKGGLTYQSSFTIEEEEVKDLEETEQEKKAKKTKEELEKLNLDQYQSLRERGEAVEDNLTLENLVRRQNVVRRQGGKAKENREKGMKGLVTAWREEVIWSDLKNFDKVMNGITGFAEFKEELRKRTKVAHYYRSIGKKMPQTFYCLCGKAGVGKTEIVKTLGKSYKRPIVMIGMAGQSHTKVLKGMRPTLENATYGRVAEAFIEATNPVFRTKKEWEAKLEQLKKKTKLTNHQKEFKEYIEGEIKAIEEQETDRERLQVVLKTIDPNKSKKDRICYLNLEERIKNLSGKWYALPSQAPIILLDEFEKVKEETVMFVVGQMTDREINFSYYDEFLEWDVDLSQAIIILTANYWDRVPDFVRSRCKRVNIQLLTFTERMEILRNRRDAFVREYFPSKISGKEIVNGVEIKYDEDEYNKKHAPNTYTEEQEEARTKISEAFLARCITEEFGIRGGIMNLVAATDFLIELKVDGLSEHLPTLDDGNGGGDGNFPYRIEKNIKADGEGTLNLYYQMTDSKGKTTIHLLALTQKRDVEEVEAKATKRVERYESVLNLVDDFPNYNKNWKPSEMPVEKLDEETEEKINQIQGDYKEIKVKRTRYHTTNTDEKGYWLDLEKPIDDSETKTPKLWLDKAVAEDLEIIGEANFHPLKKFYVLENWINDRQKNNIPLEKIIVRKGKIIKESEWQKLLT